MKDYDYKGILNVLSEASPSHLALASFIVFPIVLDYWLQALLKLFPEISTCWKVTALVVLVMIYIGCLIWLAKEASLKRALEIKRDLILGRLSSNNWSEMGFDSAKKVLGETCTDENIHEVIQTFPQVIRFVRLRVRDNQRKIKTDQDGNPIYKAGVGLVKVEEANDHGVSQLEMAEGK